MQQIKYRNLSEIKLLPNNPRFIKDKQFETLCRSIGDNPEYFEARPIILSDRTGELIIIAGNQRYRAAEHIKLKQVPTYLISGLTEEKEQEIIIRDNISNGEWDWDILGNEWDENKLDDWGLKIPNFISDEIEDLSDKLNSKFAIEINCQNEKEQEKIFKELKQKGYKCRILTL